MLEYQQHPPDTLVVWSWVSLVVIGSDCHANKVGSFLGLWHLIVLASFVDRDVNGGPRRPKLTSSVISDVKLIIYIYIF